MVNEHPMVTTPEGAPTNPLEIRKRAELPRVQVAGRAKVSELTLRLYEGNPLSVSPRMRRHLDAVYREIARQTPPRAA